MVGWEPNMFVEYMLNEHETYMLANVNTVTVTAFDLLKARDEQQSTISLWFCFFRLD